MTVAADSSARTRRATPRSSSDGQDAPLGEVERDGGGGCGEHRGRRVDDDSGVIHAVQDLAHAVGDHGRGLGARTVARTHRERR